MRIGNIKSTFLRRAAVVAAVPPFLFAMTACAIADGLIAAAGTFADVFAEHFSETGILISRRWKRD